MTLRRLPANSNDPTSPRLFMDDATGVVSTDQGSTLNDPSSMASQGFNVDGSINIKAGTVYITKGTAANITWPAPKAGAQSAGGDDGRPLIIINESGVAHVLTAPANTLNNSLHILTMTAAVGAAMYVAQNGKWWAVVVGGALT